MNNSKHSLVNVKDKTRDKLRFTIDAELLRELGERLVGKPHIALAELVKNSYDADATEVTIKFLPHEDRIEISDDGYGMTLDEFKNFWMRIGTIHKKKEERSRGGRLMTGSKGVGRLAVQFLAHELRIITFPAKENRKGLEAHINWKEALEPKSAKTKELTQVEVTYSKLDRDPSDPQTRPGTLIILEKLKDDWTEDLIRDLASELWWLQPPFGSASPLDDSKNQFRINFKSTQTDYTETFVNQMKAIHRIWIARLVGQNINGKVTIALEFPGEHPIIDETTIQKIRHNQKTVNSEKYNSRQYRKNQFNRTENLNKCYFEIRIYNLRGKQKFGIKVDTAREYFKNHSGVHVYDGGFRLPYYGLTTSDWLNLEYDHSHRRSISDLFPREIQAPKALHDLPTLGRVFGSVHINTSEEPNLEIMITRDRLAKTIAYDDLVLTVRYAMDQYANETALRKLKKEENETSSEPTSLKFERVERVLEEYESEIPKEVYQEVYKRVQEATTAAESHQERVLEQMGLLAPLATAGISALSYQHELKKQFSYIESTIHRMKNIETMSPELQKDLQSLSTDLVSWLKRAKATNLLFDYIADAENTQLRHSLRARAVIEEITHQTSFLARGTEIDYSQLDNDLYLPEASFAEWGAIFQNIFINAFTAMLDSPKRLLHISFRSRGKSQEILIQDTGYGINLQNSDRLFEPFQRASKISAERKALGYGGSGLGLTIIRLLANNIGCRVRFVEPEDGFKTAFSIAWREIK